CARSCQGPRRRRSDSFPRAIRIGERPPGCHSRSTSSPALSTEADVCTRIAPVKKLRVLVLMHDYLVPPADMTGVDVETAQWRTEYDVVKTLKEDLEHEVHVLGVKGALAGNREANVEFKPHIAFNLVEADHEDGTVDQNV